MSEITRIARLMEAKKEPIIKYAPLKGSSEIGRKASRVIIRAVIKKLNARAIVPPAIVKFLILPT